MALTYVDAVLDRNTLYSQHSPALNLLYGAQGGYWPRIGMIAPDGKNYAEWISNHAYVKRNLIPVLMQAPKFFYLLPDAKKMVAIWKSVMEDQPLSIDGLTSGLSVDTDEHPVGGAGEMQEEVTNVTRARSSLSFSYKEKAGKTYTKLFDWYIRYGMMDPDTKTPLVSRWITDIKQVQNMYTPDYYTSTMLFIEPDITNKEVNDAWLCTNMFPKTTGDRSGKRDVRSGGETIDHSIDFSCITMNNSAVITLAKGILPGLSILKKIPDFDVALPITEIEPDIKSATHTGFNREYKK